MKVPDKPDRRQDLCRCRMQISGGRDRAERLRHRLRTDIHGRARRLQESDGYHQITAKDVGAEKVVGDDKIAKVSIVGMAMRSHSGVATKVFETLAAESINILGITTSEIKISCLIEEKYTELAVRVLHNAFDLGKQAEA